MFIVRKHSFEKLDSIQDGYLHYQLLRFCQVTRLQYIFITTFCSVIDAFCHSNTFIARLLTVSWKRELNNMQMTGIPLVRSGHTWSSTYRMLTVVLVWLLLLRILLFILLRHTLWLDLVPLPRNVRVCGYPRMTLRTHPHGPRPHESWYPQCPSSPLWLQGQYTSPISTWFLAGEVAHRYRI